MEFARMGLPPVRETCTRIVDALALARRLHPGQKNSLNALCDRYQIDRYWRIWRPFYSTSLKLNTTLLIEVWQAALCRHAREVILQHRDARISFIQRHLRIGYELAEQVLEALELVGLVSAPDEKGKRQILR
jgi:hypothetical protein